MADSSNPTPTPTPTPQPGIIDTVVKIYKTLSGKGEADAARSDYQQQEQKAHGQGMNYYHEDDSHPK